MANEGRIVLITPLTWANILVGYAFFVMQNYLTDVWGLSFTHAAAILNFWGGLYMILPGFFLYIVDEFSGHFGMLVLSSVAYTLGIMFVTMSGPPVLANSTGTCKKYESDCIGSTQKALFYTGMVLIAVGMAGHKVSLFTFIEKQSGEEGNREEGNGKKGNGENGNGKKGNGETSSKWTKGIILGHVLVVLVALTGAIALPYIKPWTIRFLIPAIGTALATILFLCGSCLYKKDRKDTGSPVTNVFRVFVVSATKMGIKYPLNNMSYYRDDQTREEFGPTRCLRCLQKAAIDTNPDEPIKDKWKVCTVKQVKEAQIAVRMIPMWMTFIICGIVSSIGNTYFVEQASNMNRKVWKWNVPLQTLRLLFGTADISFSYLADTLLYEEEKDPPVKRKLRISQMPAFGIGMAMIFAILCCITAAKIEEKRLGVIRRHDLLEKPDDDIPMRVYWLLFQFFLLAGLDSFLQKSVVAYYAHQPPESMKEYLDHFTSGVSGLGFMFSVLSVYVVGRISERGGRLNWFQDTLSKSRLDRYYWVLSGMSAVNFVVFVVVAIFYRYKENVEGEDVAGFEKQPKTGEDVKECCCF